MEIPPYVRDATRVKETTESGRALPRIIRGIRATTVKSTVENTIKVTRKKSRDQRINLEMKIFKEEVSSRIAVRRI